MSTALQRNEVAKSENHRKDILKSTRRSFFSSIYTLLLNEPRANAYLERFGLHGLVSSSRENTSYLTNFLSVTHVQDRMYNVAPGSGENYMQVYGLFPRGGKPVLILPTAMYMFSQFD